VDAWRQLASIFRAADGLHRHEAVARNDALALMDRRGVSRMSEGSDQEDYRLVSVAQPVAAPRLYPAISGTA
jgi:hypothetical protein